MNASLRLLPLLTLASLLAAGPASAAVSTQYHPDTQRLTITGDNAADSVAPTCSNNNVLVGGVDTTADCDVIRGFDINLGNGTNSANLTGLTVAAGFTNLGDPQKYTGGTGADTFTGATSSKWDIGAKDIVNTGGGNDTIVGNAGGDELTGGAGLNDINGGADDDTVFETAPSGGAIYNAPHLFFGDSADKDDLTSVERISFAGGSGPDTISLATFPGTASIVGGGGGDQLIGTENGDFIRGDEGNDSIDGGGGDDTLVGAANSDTIHGGAGKDGVYGGGTQGNPSPGADHLYGEGEGDTLDIGGSAAGATADGGPGSDYLSVAQGLAQSIDGGSGVEDTLNLTGSPLTVTATSYGAGTHTGIERVVVTDAIEIDAHAFPGSLKAQVELYATANIVGAQGPNEIGQSGGDGTITGGPSADTISSFGATVRGGGGADTLSGGGVNAVIEDNVGSATVTKDKIDRISGADVKLSGFGLVVLNGTDGADVIDASARTSKVEIHGGAGDDTLTGSNVYGDTLDAGTGIDMLKGLGGHDTFLARNSSATTIECGNGNDTGERDAIDSVVACENVLAPPIVPDNPGGGTEPGNGQTGGPGGTGGTGGGQTGGGQQPLPLAGTPRFATLGTKVKKGKLTVTVACDGDTACTGRLTLKTTARKPLTLFSKAYTIGAKGKRSFTVKLSKKALKQLKAAKKKGLKVRATATAGGHSATRVVTLR